MTKQDNIFQKGFIISSLLHLLLIGVFFFGMPAIFERLPEREDIMTFEIVQISDITNLKIDNNVSKKSEKEQKNTRIIPKSSVKKQKSKEKKLKDQKKEPIKPVKPKKQDPVKKPEKKKQPEKVKTQKPKLKKTPDKEDQIDSILKNLEQESKGNKIKADQRKLNSKVNGKKSLDNNNENLVLSADEVFLIKREIEKYWRNPVNIDDISGIKIVLNIKFAKDGSITDVTAIEIICPQNVSSVCKLAKDSAISAVKQASPIENLLAARYNLWKEFNLEFDLDQMAQ